MRPCASMTMMPSTAESMTARHRASLALKLTFEMHALREVVQHPRELALAADAHLADGEVHRETPSRRVGAQTPLGPFR